MVKGSFRVPFFLAAFAAALSVIGGPVAAQSTGDIKGHVQDGQGQAFAGVTAKLLQAGKAGSQERASDAEGNVHFDGLTSGVYIVTVAKEGYSPVTCPGLRIVGITRQLQITLMPAGGQQPSSCRQAESD
ncbi:MAG TPA: carboxypeptidase-like regulatory domain-containing protein [Thermoanaerobaculia bacterium]|nr:carboxypeptidase-like regulatory domain-containing protein [Thermoanaerobaculia bacterium]